MKGKTIMIMAVMLVALVGTSSAATDLKVTSTNLKTLNSFTYSGAWYNVAPNNYMLKWYGGGEKFEQPFKAPAAYGSIITATTMADYKGYYWGECVSMVKNLAHSSKTATGGGWSMGKQVMSNTITPGTVIARFSRTTAGKYVYNNGNHAAIFREYTRDSSGKIDGMMVWDQNWGYDGLVRMHKISKTGTGSVSDANSYYVVQV